MKRLLPAALCLLLLNGCFFWNRKPKSTPTDESPQVATSVERDFKVRWVEKRSADLIATGIDPTAAHDQAVKEFDVKFSETHVATEEK